MVGILCEKPSAARNFAKALGGPNGTFNNERYVIVSARGHLYEFAQPDEMVPQEKSAQYKSWDTANLPWDAHDFDWKYVKKKGVSDMLKNIKTALAVCDEIVIATDNDPSGEGDLLAHEIIAELNLIRGKRFSRMYFEDETVSSIQKAFKTRESIADFQRQPAYIKGLYRAKFDFMTMQFTRISTMCGDGKSVIRQGRLKSAMVQIVGDGLAALAAYKKVPFYSNRFKDENGNTYSNVNEPVFADKTQVPNVYHTSNVILDKTERKSTPPKKLLDLAALSAMLAPRGYKAKQILETYQKMYEAQIVSYPRTEDKIITPEQFNDLLPLADKIADVVGVDKRLLTHRMPRTSHVKTGAAHGANRPGPKVPDSLQSLASYGDAAPVIYELLAKSYLAMLAEDYCYDAESGHLESYPDFKGKSAVPVSLGWKQVFSGTDDDDKDVSNKHLGKQASPFVYEGFPPKPPVPTLQWLTEQLDKHDVGTGATRTSTYADVTSENTPYPLLIDKKGKIAMAECGEMSYKLLADTHIGSISLTEELQHDMRDIAAGKLNPDVCLDKIAGYVIDDLKTMTLNGKTIQKKAGTEQMTDAKEKYEGLWNGKAVKFTRSWSGHRFTDDECEALLRGEEIEIFGLVSAKTGSTYGVRGKLTEQTYKGHEFVGFERLGYANDPNDTSIPSVWSGHRFTDDEKEKFKNGEWVQLKGVKSNKTGKTYNVTLEWDSVNRSFIPHFDN